MSIIVVIIDFKKRILSEKVFVLKEDEEYIELNQLLKLMQLVQSGGHAKIVIEDGLVMVNGEVEYRKRKKMRDDEIAELDGQRIIVQKAS